MKSYIVDSFTSRAFKGNPAGVCFPEHEPGDEEMQQIAMELGLSETAFVKEAGRSGTYRIRYFSPVKEIPLCGHATLASARILFDTTGAQEIRFITIENLDLLVKKRGKEIVMEFPVYPTTEASVPAAMLDALGLEKVINTAFSEKNNVILLEIADTSLLAGLRPDFAALVRSYEDINGVLVTAPSAGDGYDFHYRYFWPWAGTNEDPVTGGVQTFLANYWGERLGRKKMKAFQSSARTGQLSVELQGAKVLVSGEAVVILEGNLLVTAAQMVLQ